MIEYVKVSQLGRATAILLTAGVEVKLWGFDLEAYFRVTGKQRSAWWMSGFVHGVGYGYDPRIQFGQRVAPVLCGRQSCFMAVISRELRRLEARYAPRDEHVIVWLQACVSLASTAPVAERHALMQLLFARMFVVDVGAACQMTSCLRLAVPRCMSRRVESGRISRGRISSTSLPSG